MVRWLVNRLRRRTGSGEPPSPRNAYCSFCRRSHHDVGPLAEGPGLVFICRECVAVCGRLIADHVALRAAAAGEASGHPAPG